MFPLYDKGYYNWDRLVQSPSAHPGLLFDKFPDGWADCWHTKLSDQVKPDFYKKTANRSQHHLEAGLERMLDQQEKLVKNLRGETLEVRADWRFVSGLGAAHPYEAGFIWHRTLGVPYLPGSSVKGMIRVWAEQWCDEETKREASRLFGPKDDEHKKRADTGTLIFFDALPAALPHLEVDIVNPHYKDYYEKGDTPPADYLSPVPVYFLTVAPQQSFGFSIAPRPRAYPEQTLEDRTKKQTEDVQKGMIMLTEALEILGAGGKTAVGYGVMRSIDDLKKEAKEEDIRRQMELKSNAELWLKETIERLKNDKDLKAQPEETIWKKPLSESWLVADKETKEYTLELIKEKWRELGIDWDNPEGRSAIRAKNNFSR